MKDKDIIKLLEDIRYSVYNSSIMIVQTNSRFTYAMSKYIRDYPEYFEKDIEDFRNGLDYDSLQSLNSWIFQRKLDGNLIDFIVFGILQGIQTKWYLVPIVGIAWFLVYYFVFKFAILKFNLKTPGRENIGENDNIKLGGYDEERLLRALGGKENIVSLDNCITRLRMSVKDIKLIDENEIKATGALAVVKLDNNNLQVVIGPQVHVVKNKLDKLIKNSD